MSITFRIEHFEGPLDLLLQLVEQEELDISSLALAKIAEQFVAYVEATKAIPPEELADFLVVAAKLMYLKSKLLVPSLHDPELEEGPDLETQLREYRKFVAASQVVNRMWNEGRRSFVRIGTGFTALRTTEFVPPPGLNADVLLHAMRRVIQRLEPLIRLPERSLERMVTIQEKIRDLFRLIKKHVSTTFQTLLSGSKDRGEAIVSFLALLELVKQRFVVADQGELFNDINIAHAPNAPQYDSQS